MSTDNDVFKFVPLSSFVHGSFWHKLTELKLDVDRLSAARREITGIYSNSDVVHCLAEVDGSAFNQTLEQKANTFSVYGALHNQNTIEEFKKLDKSALLNAEGKRIWRDIESGACLQNPARLARFVLLSFADLKKHHFYYWFAFPAGVQPVATSCGNFVKVKDAFSDTQLQQLNRAYYGIERPADRSFFVIEQQEDTFTAKRLADVISVEDKSTNFSGRSLYFCFSDPSCFENAGWPARLFLTMLAALCPNLRGTEIRLLAVRSKQGVSVENSLLYRLRLNAEEPDRTSQFIGWEADKNKKMLPRLSNMAASMDPERLAKTSVDLNLKLMKWRLMPTLDLEAIAGTRCLLMGAGTLGCAVARNLLAWGVKHITFIDNGKVSYSNPVRQCLFTFDDAMQGSDKATTAAKRLADICPGLKSVGHNMHIPMPGHPIGDGVHMQETAKNIERLTALIEGHDVIFLLTDSRESRWLPTMLGAFYNKIVVNAALGFDTYLVMRHGSRRTDLEPNVGALNIDGLKCIPGQRLGCYFCNDITAPGNSLKDRTLDQQCTVTRPGVSYIASALLVELLVSVLQHELRELAPAYHVSRTTGQTAQQIDSTEASIPEGLLGILPHSIRGQLSGFQHILPATEQFAGCIACSEKVLGEYRTKGFEMLRNAFDSAKYLEELTGINKAFHFREDQDLLELSDECSSD